jgi:hypothetical protein
MVKEPDMQQLPILSQADYHVLPATILSAEPIDEQDTSNLRADASSNGICYLYILRSLHDGTCLARVAAHPDLLTEQGYTVVLSEGSLACEG